VKENTDMTLDFTLTHAAPIDSFSLAIFNLSAC
jgi:hypothetical protein